MEQVVLVNEHGDAIGVANKAQVHTSETPLHLAFSCYLLNTDGQLLVTRRSLSKLTWPGVWTNSFCGHPAPGEDLTAAVERRALHELGATVSNITLQLPDFRYRAIDTSGIVENEICPVFSAVLTSDLHPSRSEVEEWAWVTPDHLVTAASLTPFAFSPWSVAQLEQLDLSGIAAITQQTQGAAT